MTFLILKDSIYLFALCYIIYYFGQRICNYVQSKINSGSVVQTSSRIEEPKTCLIKNESGHWILGDYIQDKTSFNTKVNNIKLQDCKVYKTDNEIYISGKMSDIELIDKIRAGYSDRYRKFFIKSTGEEITECKALEINNNRLYINRNE